MQLWEILVPTIRNTGKPFTTRHHKEWDKRVRALSKGLTVYTPAKGQWLDVEGNLFEERMIPVRLACTPKILNKIMDITAQHYDQKAVMAYKVSDEVVIRDYTPTATTAPVRSKEPEHILMAKFWKARVPQYGELFIVEQTFNNGATPSDWWLSERLFAAVEVEWRRRWQLPSLAAALEVNAQVGIKDWFDCLKPHKQKAA